MLRKFSDMTKWERRLFGFGAFVVAAVMVLFQPDNTMRGLHRVLSERLGP